MSHLLKECTQPNPPKNLALWLDGHFQTLPPLGVSGPCGKDHLLRDGKSSHSPPQPAYQASAPAPHRSLCRKASSVWCRLCAGKTHLCRYVFYSSSISLGLPGIAAELLGSTDGAESDLESLALSRCLLWGKIKTILHQRGSGTSPKHERIVPFA